MTSRKQNLHFNSQQRSYTPNETSLSPAFRILRKFASVERLLALTLHAIVNMIDGVYLQSLVCLLITLSDRPAEGCILIKSTNEKFINYLVPVDCVPSSDMRFMKLGLNSDRINIDVGSLPYMDMSSRRVNSVPPYTFQGDNWKLLEFRRLPELYSEGLMLTIDDNMAALDLSTNILKGITANAFSRLSTLQILLLEGNMIESLSAMSFTGLIGLRLLSLRSNIIKTIENWTFNNMMKLESLDLTENDLKNIYIDWFGWMKALRYIMLGQNVLTDVCADYPSRLPELIDLYLDGNMITNLTENCFGGLLMLRKLTLNSNKLNNVQPKMFAGLRYLEILDLTRNYAESSIYGSICRELPSLRELRIVGNNFQNLQYCNVVDCRKNFPIIISTDNIEIMNIVTQSYQITTSRKLNINFYDKDESRGVSNTITIFYKPSQRLA